MEGDEDVETSKVLKDPRLPTPEQIEEHNCTHIPFRDWCSFCIMGRGRGNQHRRNQGHESSVPVVGVDYFFITTGGMKKRSELEQELTPQGEAQIDEARRKGELVKCLIVRCFRTKLILAHVVPCKGVDEERWVANLVCDDVLWIGHSEFIMKSDNENSLKALIRYTLEVVRVKAREYDPSLHGGADRPSAASRVSSETSPEYDSQSNGGTEVGVMLIRGLFRTIKLCLEARIGKIIPIGHALIPWLLEHTTMLLNAKCRGQDGLTPWQRVRGRPFNQHMLGFGEMVLHKLPHKDPKSNADGNMGSRWSMGAFLGFHRQSRTYLVATDTGISRPRSIYRRPVPDRWSSDALAKIQATPWSTRDATQTEVRFHEHSAEPPAIEARAREPPRRFRINLADLREHGFTDSCANCRHIQRYGKSAPGVQHSEACRERILDALSKTAPGRQRLDGFEERTNRYLAEEVEAADAAQRTEPATTPSDETVLAGHNAMQQVPAAPRRTYEAPRDETALDDPFERPQHDRPQEAHTPVAQPTGDPDDSGMSQGSQEGMDIDMMGAVGAASGRKRGWSRRKNVRKVMDSLASNCRALQKSINAKEARIAAEMTSPGVHGAIGVRADEPAGETPSTLGVLASRLVSVDQRHRSAMYEKETNRTKKWDDDERNILMSLGVFESATPKAVVSEIYSPPRVTEELRRKPWTWRSLMPGFALDLTVDDPDDGMPWDFSKSGKRSKAMRIIRETRPYMVIGSPCCTAFSAWQALNALKTKDPEKMRRAMARAVKHIDFVVSVYREQLENNRYFVHEHPATATSWQLRSIEELMQASEVGRVVGDQCQYGAEVQRGPAKGQPVRKPTGFMSNSPEVLRVLSRKCSGRGGTCSRLSGGRHATCSGTIAADAAIYPRKLCQALLIGIAAQVRADNMAKDGCFGVQVPDDDREVEMSIRSPENGYSGRIKDDLTGQTLHDGKVAIARAVELKFFDTKGVWKKVPRANAKAQTGKPPISVRWVDVNKGDDVNENHRSRLVARELKALDRSGACYFAPAPPLEALRTVLSMAMTGIGTHRPIWDGSSPERQQISFIDVKRAYFNAKLDPASKPVFVDLPLEDPDHETMCAQLLRHMYGTRGAADGWQEEYSCTLIGLGFAQGESCPNVFWHPLKDICTSVHGDDFTSTGSKTALDWFEAEIEKNYEVTISPRIGSGLDDAKEGRSLNRIIRWCRDSVEYEADPRQAERLIAECGLEGSGSLSTPGVKPTFQQLELDKELPPRLWTAFRGAAARANYLAADRLDGQFACKEVCRWMSKPTEHAWQALKRIGRFLRGSPRFVYTYPQQVANGVDVYTDTDWAGCPKTRKSTSGGCILVGSHAIKHWSSTQTSVALSSGEAEFAGVIRGAGQGLGYQALLRDLGVQAPLRVWTDSSAAIGICSRQGLGKLRHLDAHTLWIQQAVRLGRVDLRKVDGESNPADVLTKHSISRDRLDKLVKLHGCKYVEGRAANAPKMRSGDSGRTTMAGHGSVNVVRSQPPPEKMEEKQVDPLMPHLTFSEGELDERYPRLTAPEDEHADDPAIDAADLTLQVGQRIAEEIRANMRTGGRRRRETTICGTGRITRRPL